MDALEVLKTRRSIRKFKPDPVEKKLIETVIDCGRMAPTAINIQPWEFVVVCDSEKKKTIAHRTDYGRFIMDAPVLIAVFCSDTKYYLEDGCAATVNILNAAWALGLGTCWVAGDKKPYVQEITQLLGAPDAFHLVSLIAMGYPDDQPGSHLYKKSLKDVLRWEKF